MQIKQIAAAVTILIVTAAAIWSIDPFGTRTASNRSVSNRSASNQRGTSLSQQQTEQLPQPLVGVGIAIKPPEAREGKQRIDKGGEIIELVPNSPAAVCGELAVGDLIVAVAQGDAEPENCHGMEFADVVNLIRGPESSEVRLTVIPADQRVVKRKTVSLFRMTLQGGRLVGKEAPNVALVGLEDDREQMLSDFLGKIVILEFWTTSCAPCIISVSALQVEAEKRPGWADRVALIALSVDSQPELPREFLVRRDWPKTINAWGDEEVKRAYDAHLLPLVVIIDEAGQVVAAGDPRVVNAPRIVDGLLAAREAARPADR